MSDKLKKAEEEIEKKFGKGTFIRFGDTNFSPAEVIPTGVPDLDKALGIGGLPLGRFVELYGPESTGKSTLALHLVAEAQKKGLKVAYIDLEYSLDPKYATQLGVNVPEMRLAQPDTAEDALEIVDMLVRTGEIGLIVVDSVAALAPRAELEGEMGDALVGVVPRLLGSALRKLTGVTSKNNVLILFINQIRDKIGTFGYGETTTTPGGKAMRFFTTVRMEIKRIGAIKNGDKVIGNKTRIKIVKNKLASPYVEVECDIMFGEGISKHAGLLEKALEAGVFVKKGGWYSYNDANIAQGKENLRQLLKDVDFYTEINERLDDERQT